MDSSYQNKLQDKGQIAVNSADGQSMGNKSALQLKDNRPQSLIQKKQVEALANRQAPAIAVQKKANSTGLPDQLKSGIENLSGHSMDNVKVHYNSAKPAQLNAHAYAQGTEIHLASGQEKHLPHEAWHVAQQKQGRVKPTMQMKGKVNVNDDEALEKEADVMGAKAVQNKVVSVNEITQKRIIPQKGFPVQYVKKPSIISKDGKKTILLGTTHGVQGKDIADEVPDEMMHKAAIVLEYPSLAGTGNTTFKKSTVDAVSDKTQASLAQTGKLQENTHNLTMIGADGRKAFEGEKIHSISLRHKIPGENYNIIPKHQLIPKSLLTSLADKYVDRCLGFSGGDVISIAKQFDSIVQYFDGTNLEHVMVSTYTRMNDIAAKLPVDRRKSIGRKVMSKLEQDMAAEIAYYRENKNDYKKAGYLNALIEEVNANLISAMYDSLANLLLYTEVLASSMPNVIVAYGAEHLAPLQQLLNETRATARRKRRKKKKR